MKSAKVQQFSEKLMSWLDDTLREGQVPRLVDVIKVAEKMSKQENVKLTRKQVSQLLHLHPAYQNNLHQQRHVKRYRKWRPVLATSLGHLHGDLGFFSITDKYPTPLKYRSGFLVMVDVLSRFVYLTPLHFKRDADEMVKALQRILDIHQQHHFAHPIRSISFDQEKSVVGKKVQTFLKKNNIQFIKFTNTASKSKFAENCIGRLRAIEARLNAQHNGKKPWWTLLETIQNIFNNQPITLNGKILSTGLCPIQVTQDNVAELLELIYKEAPAYNFGQFNLDHDQVDFKFSIGTLVKAKLIVTSSAVLGIKRSAQRLGEDIFKIVGRRPVTYRNLDIGRVYVCENIQTKQVEYFDEQDIVDIGLEPTRGPSLEDTEPEQKQYEFRTRKR